MKVSDLFSADVEPGLNEWMRNFTSLDDLFLAMPQLYAKLELPSIEGIIEDGAVLSGPVHIGRGAVVHAQAIIHGPSIIGPDAVINSHTEIRSGCFIGSNCVIGHSCLIIQSMVMNNTKIAAAAFIRNSVIGYGSVVGPGAVLGSVGVDQASAPIADTSPTLGPVLGDYAAGRSTRKPHQARKRQQLNIDVRCHTHSCTGRAIERPRRNLKTTVRICAVQVAAKNNTVRLADRLVDTDTKTKRPNQRCHRYNSSRNSVPWTFSNLVVQHRTTPLAAQLDEPQHLRRSGGQLRYTDGSAQRTAATIAHEGITNYQTPIPIG